MKRKWLIPTGLAAAGLVAAGCGSSGTSTTPGSSSSPTHTGAPSSSGNALKTASVGGVTVVTNAQGRTLYGFVPDTSTTSKCNGACAAVWPPVKAPVAAGAGVTGKITTITRSGGGSQATYNGHPVYTFTGDTGPGQNHGNGLNVNGGVWHEITPSGNAPAGSSGGGGIGY